MMPFDTTCSRHAQQAASKVVFTTSITSLSNEARYAEQDVDIINRQMNGDCDGVKSFTPRAELYGTGILKVIKSLALSLKRRVDVNSTGDR